MIFICCLFLQRAFDEQCNIKISSLDSINSIDNNVKNLICMQMTLALEMWDVLEMKPLRHPI